MTEKCPACGHHEAFYEEKQVRRLITAQPPRLALMMHPFHRCVVQTRDPRFSTPYVLCYPRYRSPSYMPVSVRLLQTRVADQQLKKACCAGTSADACQPCALHVDPYTTKKGNHAETAEDARKGRNCAFPNRNSVFWKAVRTMHEFPAYWKRI